MKPSHEDGAGRHLLPARTRQPDLKTAERVAIAYGATLAVRNTPLTLAVKAVRRSPVVIDVREEGAIRAPADRLTAAYSATRSPAECRRSRFPHDLHDQRHAIPHPRGHDSPGGC